MRNTSRNPFITFFDANVTAGDTSDYFLREEYQLHCIQVISPDTDVSIDIEASNDGTTWVKVGDTVVGNKLVQISGLYRYMQVKRTDSEDTASVTVTCLSGAKFRK